MAKHALATLIEEAGPAAKIRYTPRRSKTHRKFLEARIFPASWELLRCRCTAAQAFVTARPALPLQSQSKRWQPNILMGAQECRNSGNAKESNILRNSFLYPPGASDTVAKFWRPLARLNTGRLGDSGIIS
jgi:hypothetical protein